MSSFENRRSHPFLTFEIYASAHETAHEIVSLGKFFRPSTELMYVAEAVEFEAHLVVLRPHLAVSLRELPEVFQELYAMVLTK